MSNLRIFVDLRAFLMKTGWSTNSDYVTVFVFTTELTELNQNRRRKYDVLIKNKVFTVKKFVFYEIGIFE